MVDAALLDSDLLAEGQRLLRAGRRRQARALYERLVRKAPEHVEALTALGTLVFKEGDLETALDHLARAIEIDPERAAAQRAIGDVFVALGRLVDAECAYRKAAFLSPGDPGLCIELGNVLKALGRLKEAENAYQEALDTNPGYTAAHINLGNVLKELGRREDAELHCRQAVSLAPDNPLARLTLGNFLQDIGELEEAEAEFQEAVRCRPDFPEARSNLGNLLHRLGKPEEAANSCREALRLRPNYPRAMNNLGNALRDLKRRDEAEQCYRDAIRMNPNFAEAHNNLAIVTQEAGRIEEAESHFRSALRVNPAFADAYNHLGDLLFKRNRVEEASACYRDALRIKPDFPECQINLGNSLRDLRRPQDAERCYREALRLKPGYAEAYNNLGIIAQDGGDLAQAEVHYREAIRLKPNFVEAHTNLALGLLRDGRLPEGWVENEWRWKKKDRTPLGFDQPRWDGDPLGDRVLMIHAEQGFGDTLQFCRYLPLLETTKRIIFEVQPALMRLLGSLEGNFQLVAQGSPLPPFDVHCPLLSLPGILETSLETVPATVPYLAASPGEISHWRERAANLPGLKVGLTWAGNPSQGADRNRSIRLERLLPLADVAGVSFVSLQKGAGTEQVTELADEFPIHDWMDECRDFADTAALVEVLDLVIAVDTSVIHLAGALGKPVWLLNRYDNCWRWLLERTDSPWYPSLRQFRQKSLAEWDDVIVDVRTALLEKAGGQLRERPAKSPKPSRKKSPSVTRAANPPVRRTRKPASVEAFDKAAELHKDGKFAEAEEILRAALADDPTDSEMLNARGVMLAGLGRHAEALSSYREASRYNPTGSGVWTNLGNALTHFKYFNAAIAAHRRAISLSKPDCLLHHNLGVTLAADNQHADAVLAFTRALEVKPENHLVRWDRALSYLATGNLAMGWKDYDARRVTGQLGNRVPPGQLWDGAPYAGKRLLLLAEQGFGDTIWAARYLSRVKALGGELIVECQRDLIPLIEKIGAADEIIPRASSLPEADFHTHLCSLPGLFTPDLASIPDRPYLTAPMDRMRKFKHGFDRAGSQLKVGIVWSGSVTFKKNQERAQSLANFLRAFAMPGVQLYSLQKGPRTSELAETPDSAAVIDLAPLLEDFADTAAAIAGLDLVIMTDSAVAHLTGALGKPVWVLLGQSAHWLWLLDRVDSPWYPSMRLFRPRSHGDWDAVFDRAAAELMAMTLR